MLVAIALAAEVRLSNPGVSEKTAQQYAQWTVDEAERVHVDPWVFHAVIHKESRWTATAVNYEGNGSCSVGLGQINGNCSEKRIAHLSDPRENLRRVAEFFRYMKTNCKKSCSGVAWIAPYNPGDPTYARTVETAIKRLHARHTIDVRQVLVDVHSPRLSWKKPD